MSQNKILIQRYKTHDRKTRFESTDYFCMNCGEKQVWEDDCDDYYQGNNFVCFKCGSQWANPRGVQDCDWFDQIKKQLEESNSKNPPADTDGQTIDHSPFTKSN